ncbi:MAG: DegT/DnrJ/EryC1/StrS family aminotransferase [Ruminococcaceae bacterium]|nr:DegT/DnrJ/EryC1/StrS family aminotransferase [Oscillospiraceae bacterium]
MERVGKKEHQYVEEVLRDGFRTSANGKMTRRLEEAFAEKFDSQYAIAFCNGTATLHAALEAVGAGLGDEVIVPPLTMSSTTFAVLHANATPVFADVEPDTFLISAKSIEACITPKTKAIIPVSLFGLAPDYDAINAIAKKHGLAVIEDDAQCFLGKYKGKIVGTLGDISSFSFQGSKHMSCGEGGMLITQSEELANKIRKYSCLGYANVGSKVGKISKKDIQDPDYCRHESLGWNYRLSDVCSAVALGQLEHLEELVEFRQKSAMLFMEAIKDAPFLTPQKNSADCENAYWAFVAKIDDDDIDWRVFRDKYMELGGDAIYAAWKLTYQEPMFRNLTLLKRETLFNSNANYADGICPVAEKLQPRLLQFKTNYFDLNEAQQQAEILSKTIQYFK